MGRLTSSLIGFWKMWQMWGMCTTCDRANLTPSFPPSPPPSARLDAALDLEYYATEPYSGSYFLEEMRGLADATGLPLEVCLY